MYMIYICIFVFIKNSTQKKHVTHVFATIRLTQLSALRMEKSADWESKRRRRPLKTSTKQGLRNSGISYKKRIYNRKISLLKYFKKEHGTIIILKWK